MQSLSCISLGENIDQSIFIAKCTVLHGDNMFEKRSQMVEFYCNLSNRLNLFNYLRRKQTERKRKR